MKDTQLLALVKRARKKDRAAFVALCEQKAEEVIFLCVREMNSRPDGEDAAQEVFIRMQKSIQDLREPQAFNVWLNRLIRYTCIDMRRRKMRENTIPYDEAPLDGLVDTAQDALPQAFVEDADKRQHVLQLVDELPDKYRACVLMHYYQRMSYVDIARVLDIKTSTVDNNLRMARRILKEKLQTEDSVKMAGAVPMIAFGPAMGSILAQAAQYTAPAAVQKACLSAAGVYTAFQAAGAVAAATVFSVKTMVQAGVATALVASLGLGAVLHVTGGPSADAIAASSITIVQSQPQGSANAVTPGVLAPAAENSLDLEGRVLLLDAQGSEDIGLGGMQLALVNETGATVAMEVVTQGEDGRFIFSNIPSGRYRLRIILPPGATLPGEMDAKEAATCE